MKDRVISYLNREKYNKFIVNQPKKYWSRLIIGDINWIDREFIDSISFSRTNYQFTE